MPPVVVFAPRLPPRFEAKMRHLIAVAGIFAMPTSFRQGRHIIAFDMGGHTVLSIFHMPQFLEALLTEMNIIIFDISPRNILIENMHEMQIIHPREMPPYFIRAITILITHSRNNGPLAFASV